MLRKFLFGLSLLMNTNSYAAAPAADPADPYLWLENVTGEAALNWVRDHNARSLKVLEAQPGFEEYRSRAEAILSDKRRIPYGDIQGDWVVNFWQDDSHVRGLWRRAPLKTYIAGKPEWETLLDLDQLAATEKENWVWKGANCLSPDYTRCLVSLSRGGKDAVEQREFDVTAKAFVQAGFRLPEAKSNVDWFEADTLMVATDYGAGSLTTSGYPRIVKLWRRGTPLSQARELYQGTVQDVAVNPTSVTTPDGSFRMVIRGLTFWTSEIYHVTDGGQLVRSPLPEDAKYLTVFSDMLVARLQSDWRYRDQLFPKGALVAYSIRPVMSGAPAAIELVYAPPANVAVDSVKAARDILYVSILDKVRGRLLAIRRGVPAWKIQDGNAPTDGALSLISADDKSNLILISHQGYTTPSKLLALDEGRHRVAFSLPERFDPKKFTTQLLYATSKDGTRVPYTIIRPKGARGPIPTWMFSYGGFDVSLLPTYVRPEVQFWLEDGGAFVVANIRGGGEFGPAWHQAALLDKRQNAFDDFYAVSEDLIKRKLTTNKMLGIDGRSNGGLLVSTAFTQRPDLFGAVLAGVPLADMRRYHLLLAGASWMGEYGNPDDPAQWAYISAYSPYQNLKAGPKYPKVFFYTSTKDDRVHPGHARKMAAKMDEIGAPYYYYENIDGGHAGVANLKESAYRGALMIAYMNSQLRKGVPASSDPHTPPSAVQDKPLKADGVSSAPKHKKKKR